MLDVQILRAEGRSAVQETRMLRAALAELVIVYSQRATLIGLVARRSELLGGSTTRLSLVEDRVIRVPLRPALQLLLFSARSV